MNESSNYPAGEGTSIGEGVTATLRQPSFLRVMLVLPATVVVLVGLRLGARCVPIRVGVDLDPLAGGETGDDEVLHARLVGRRSRNRSGRRRGERDSRGRRGRLSRTTSEPSTMLEPNAAARNRIALLMLSCPPDVRLR